MAKKSIPGVVLKETFLRARRKWIFRFVLMNLAYLLSIAGLLMVVTQTDKSNSSLFPAQQIIEEYRIKDRLYAILRTKGYSLGQGLDIAKATIMKSRELGLPLSLIMAVIHEESEFYPNAKSSKGAQGLMQIMPFKWDEYVAKLDLKVDRRAMTDPFMNITVGCQILRDLYDRYANIQDDKIRLARALTDYNNGENATNPNLQYSVQVYRTKGDYEERLK